MRTRSALMVVLVIALIFIGIVPVTYAEVLPNVDWKISATQYPGHVKGVKVGNTMTYIVSLANLSAEPRSTYADLDFLDAGKVVDVQVSAGRWMLLSGNVIHWYPYLGVPIFPGSNIKIVVTFIPTKPGRYENRFVVNGMSGAWIDPNLSNNEVNLYLNVRK